MRASTDINPSPLAEDVIFPRESYLLTQSAAHTEKREVVEADDPPPRD